MPFLSLIMNRNKICPVCEVEYLPHIEKCTDCGAVLLSHEEYKRAQAEKKRVAAEAIGKSAVVREGDLKWLGELYDVLINAGIPCSVVSDLGCNKGCCGDKCQLIVSAEDVERAQERITEYYLEIHPELRASHELAKQGKCPACGSPVSPDDTECPDCGLALVLIEEDQGGEGGGGADGSNR